MEHYVTLFDDKYLPQGLALHRSLVRFGGVFTLWILCVNQRCFDILSTLMLPNVRLLNLDKQETAALLEAKKTRTAGEYCWTLTPFCFDFVFSADQEVNRLTYIDADVWFRKSPSPIFDELEAANKKVLITDHGYAAEYDASATSGQYCVQFLVFNRCGAEAILKEWQEQCLAWCYNRSEDDKFGDQKYLDVWPSKYSDLVHVLQKEHLTLAPWNASRFPYGNSIIWHFHGLRLSKSDESNLMNINLCETYPLLNVVKRHIYFPYVKDLSDALKTLDSVRASV